MFKIKENLKVFYKSIVFFMILFAVFAWATNYDSSKPSHTTLWANTITGKSGSSVNLADDLFVVGDLILSTGNKLSIGVTNPSEELNVSGDVGVSGTVSANKFVGDGSGLTGVGGGGGSGDGHSLDAADGSPVDVVYVDNDGDVGIGTASPLRELHIVDNDANADLQVERTGSNPSIASLSAQGDAVVVGSNSNDPLLLVTNVGEKMRITSGGDVGIGTPTPSAKLEVLGNIQQDDNYQHCFGDACDAKIYFNGTSLIIQVN